MGEVTAPGEFQDLIAESGSVLRVYVITICGLDREKAY